MEVAADIAAEVAVEKGESKTMIPDSQILAALSSANSELCTTFSWMPTLHTRSGLPAASHVLNRRVGTRDGCYPAARKASKAFDFSSGPARGGRPGLDLVWLQ